MRASLICVVVVFQIFISAQSPGQSLDGRTFEVSMKIGKEHDSNQNIIFSGGKMTFTEAGKYGFAADVYKWKRKNDSTQTFLVVLKSTQNGVMTWEGKVINDKTEGTCIWTRKVENPINYLFAGKELKK